MSRSKKDRKRKASRPPPRGLPSGHAGRGKASSRDRNGGQGPPYAGGSRGLKPAARYGGGSRGLKPAARHRLLDAFKSKWLAVRFLGVLGLLVAVFYALYAPFTQGAVFDSYLALLADACGPILRVLGQEVTVAGRSILSPRFSIEVSMGCDGLEMIALFVAAVLALPVRLRSRLFCVLLGTVILMVINLLRIVSLFCIGVYFPNAVDTMHFDAWPGVLIVVILLCWLIWARWAVRREGSFAGVSVNAA